MGTEIEPTVKDLLDEVQAELTEEFSTVKKRKLKKMLMEIRATEQLLATRKAQLTEFLDEPLALESNDVFLLGE